MKALHGFKLAAISLLLVVGLAACDTSGPAGTAGKKLDQTADAAAAAGKDAGKKIEQSVDAAGKKINETTDKVGEKMGEQSAKAGAVIDDAAITAKVKAAIFAEPDLKTLQIGVETVQGVVTLTGSVDTQASSDRVKLMAAATAGVKKVDNKLAIKSTVKN